jgi:hypothetical protein
MMPKVSGIYLILLYIKIFIFKESDVYYYPEVSGSFTIPLAPGRPYVSSLDVLLPLFNDLRCKRGCGSTWNVRQASANTQYCIDQNYLNILIEREGSKSSWCFYPAKTILFRCSLAVSLLTVPPHHIPLPLFPKTRLSMLHRNSTLSFSLSVS